MTALRAMRDGGVGGLLPKDKGIRAARDRGTDGNRGTRDGGGIAEVASEHNYRMTKWKSEK